MVRRPSNEDPYPSPSQTSPSCLDSKWGIPSYLMRSPTHHIICPHILTVGMSDQAIQWRHLLIIFLCVSGNLSIPPGRSPKCVHRFETLSKILWIFFLHKSYDNFFHNYCLKEEIFINWCELIFFLSIRPSPGYQTHLRSQLVTSVTNKCFWATSVKCASKETSTSCL